MFATIPASEIRRAAVLLAVLLLSTACGFRGPLYLPGETGPTPPALWLRRARPAYANASER
jgi:predicted small lipoprotein YifL